MAGYRRSYRGLLLYIFLVIGVLITGFVFFGRSSGRDKVQPIIDTVTKVITLPTPTPYPFQELTIPYLREREYSSTLASFQKVNETSAYVSYITSYNSDGLKVYGLLTEPKGIKPEGGWPAIVFIHGYIQPERYKTQVNYASYVDYLAKNGFVVFKVDLRGHGDSEGEPGGTYYSSDYVIDALNAYSALQSTNFINPGRIGLWGHSMAGNIVVRSLAANRKIPAVVVWAGAGYTYSDLQEYGIDDDSYRPPPDDSERARKRQELRDNYGDFDSSHWFWKQVPATNYFEGVNGAIQLHHAVNDNVVSIEYSRNLNTLLNQTVIQHELNEYVSGGHNLTGNSFTEAMGKSVEFFRAHLN